MQTYMNCSSNLSYLIISSGIQFFFVCIKSNDVYFSLFLLNINYYFLNSELMYLLIVFVLNTNSLDFLILIPNLCILWINLDLQIFLKSNSLYSSLFWIKH
jgi:hypothetical protein